MRRYRYKRRKTEVHRQERSFHRWLAIFMAAVLMLSESNLTILAQEDTPNVEVSEEEVSAEVSMEGTEETDEDGEKDTDDTDGTEGEDELPDDGGDDISDTDGTEGEGELSNKDNEEGNNCVCVSRCSEDMVNEDCPACTEDYVNCIGQEKEVSITEDGVADSEDKGIEMYAVGDTFFLGEFRYRIIKDDEDDRQVEVTDGTLAGNDVIIPEIVVDYNGSPYRVTSVGDDAFNGCSSLTSIKIPDGVTNIGERAFYECSSLPSIEIPDSVTRIGDTAFRRCNSLTSIKIPNGVTSIGNETFSGCYGLTSIEIPDGVTSIGDAAFSGCWRLASIKIPNGVTSIGDSAFEGCSSLTGSIKIPDGVTSIGDATFSGCSRLASIKIPDGVTSIGDRVFYGCSSLTSIKIPDGVTSIGDRVFDSCSSLTSIEIPDGVTSIGERAFYQCSRLASIKIPESVTSIGDNVFSECSSLTSIEIPDGVTSIGDGAFSRCQRLASIKIPDGVTSIGGAVFSGCYGLTSIEIPDGVTSIGDGAFSGCWRLVGIKIPDGVTSIGDAAFYGCWRLASIKIPDGVTSIGAHAFRECKNLTGSIKIPDGVTSIGDRVFNGCSSLTSIEIPNGITSIGKWAFLICFELRTLQIVIPSDRTDIIPPEVAGDAFANTPDDRYIVFVTEDGSPLTGDALKAAQNAFKIDDRDGNAADNLWWGWKLGDITDDTYHITYHLDGYEASQEDSTYTYGIGITLPKPQHSDYDFDGWYINAEYSGEKVTSIGSTETGDKVYYGQWKKKPESTYSVDVIARRDDVEWENHGRTFMLLSASDGSLTANFETVKQGEYFIYDVTGVPSESLTKDGVNTGVRVSVEDKDVEAFVDYYTVTFYDGSTAYEDSTPQAMQTVLGGKKAKEPDAPSKEGYKFRQWVTENESEAFNFNTPIERKSSVYASWISDTAKEYCIAALADEGGSISPGGNVWVQEGGTQTFEITPDDGYRIKSVTVDGMDRTDELTDSASARAIRAQAETSRYYTFVDVREEHIIRATFEKESSSEDSGNIGTGDNGGDSGNTDTDDNTVINISNIENTGGSPVENSNLNTNSGDARVISTSTNNNTSNPSKDAEPKTGDTSQVEIYATVAMIAGLTYLLLYFADKEKGMTEEKKQELVSSMIGWAKRGRRIRKYVILVPIFILLCYYHSIGKRIEVEWDEEPVWAEL